MKKNILYFFVIFFLISTQIQAQTVSVEANVDSSQYLIGDLIRFTITAEYSKNIKLLNPSVKDSLKGLEILEFGKPAFEETDTKKITKFNFTLAKYDSGDVTIPRLNLFYLVGKDTADTKLLNLPESELLKNSKVRVISTNPVKFRVNLVKVDLKKDIKDVKGPIKIPYNLKELLLWILVLLVFISAGVYFYLRYKKKKEGTLTDQKIIKLPPHITALNDLRKLREKQLWQQGLVKEYHSAITEIIRVYFEERFNLPALEMTTDETLKRLKENKETVEILPTTKKFLKNADLVKFAKFVPLKSVNEEMMQQAEEIVNKTKVEKIPSAGEDENV